MIVVGDAQLERHILVALGAHIRRRRLEGMAVPPSVLELSMALRACTALDGSAVAADGDSSDGAVMALTLTFREAAELVGVSESTVKRLVDAEALGAVHIGRSRRIRAQDVRRYVAELPPSSKGKK